jgi:hypothetical protein
MTDPVTMKHENVCELERMGGSLAIEPGILPMVRLVESPSNRLELDAVGTMK